MLHFLFSPCAGLLAMLVLFVREVPPLYVGAPPPELESPLLARPHDVSALLTIIDRERERERENGKKVSYM